MNASQFDFCRAGQQLGNDGGDDSEGRLTRAIGIKRPDDGYLAEDGKNRDSSPFSKGPEKREPSLIFPRGSVFLGGQVFKFSVLRGAG